MEKKAAHDKDERVVIRVEAARKSRYTKAAASRGMKLSEWVRFALDSAAERDVNKSG
jgi:uncharacterized protein (DUF1778 family)